MTHSASPNTLRDRTAKMQPEAAPNKSAKYSFPLESGKILKTSAKNIPSQIKGIQSKIPKTIILLTEALLICMTIIIDKIIVTELKQIRITNLLYSFVKDLSFVFELLKCMINAPIPEPNKAKDVTPYT